MASEPGHTDAHQVAMELRFLSGSARGQCHYATGDGISVGDDETCDVQVPGDQLDSNECRHVRIQYSHTGWSLRNLGTSMVAVNHTMVAGEARLRSGDVIRLSLAGPELMFSVVAERSCPPPAQMATAETTVAHAVHLAQPRSRSSRRYAVAAMAAFSLLLLLLVCWALLRTDRNSVISLDKIPEQSVDEGQQWAVDISDYVRPPLPDTYGFRSASALPNGMVLNEESGHMSWTPSESHGPGSYPVQIEVRSLNAGTAEVSRFTIQVREVNTSPQLQAIPDTTFALGTREALEIQIEAVDGDFPRQQIEYRLGANPPAGMSVDRVTGLVRWAPKREHAGQTYPVEILVNDPATAQSPQRLSFRVTVLEPAAETPAESDVTAAIYLLVIEEPGSGTLFPFAVAFAVRDDLLLTSGAVVQELAKAQEKGMALLAMHCLSQQHEDITSLYLEPDYASLQDRPDEQIYKDVGAVQLASKKRSVVPLAAAANATPLDQGTPLRCVMPLFEAEPLTRFDNITPTYHNAKIYVVTRRNDTNSPPDTSHRLLSLVGTLPKNAYGSPMVDEQGQVVAVYVEKADLSQDKSLANLVDRYHYALCLDSLAGLLNDGLSAWLLVPNRAHEDSARENQ